jgi:hypothetical protein
MPVYCLVSAVSDSCDFAPFNFLIAEPSTYITLFCNKSMRIFIYFEYLSP